MNLTRMWAVATKDWLDLQKNRGLLFSLMVFPLVVTVAPVLIVLAYVKDMNDPALRAMAWYYDPQVTGKDAAQFLIEKTLNDWFTLFLTMPVFIPVLISSSSIAGEKERRTLEPLLATPVTAVELVVGKSLASLMPAMAITLFSFVILCVGIDVATFRAMGKYLLPNGMWMYGILVVTPCFAFFGNGVSVLISARVKDSRIAQQLSGLFVMPLVGLAAAQFIGALKAGIFYYAMLGGIVLLLDIAIIAAARRIFSREYLMTHWG